MGNGTRSTGLFWHDTFFITWETHVTENLSVDFTVVLTPEPTRAFNCIHHNLLQALPGHVWGAHSSRPCSSRCSGQRLEAGVALQRARGQDSQNGWEHLWGHLGCRLFASSVFGDIVLHLSVKPLPGPLWNKGRTRPRASWAGAGWILLWYPYAFQ